MDIPVYIGTSKTLNSIRCVNAGRNIKAGELIESCPIILIPKAQWDTLDKTELGHYNYAWNEENDCIVLGYCGLVNHSFTPNALYQHNYEINCMEYIALSSIPKNTEITVNYNGEPENTEPLDPDYVDAKR